MEMFPNIKALIGLIAVALMACDKNENSDHPPIDFSKLNECFRSSHWDNKKIKDALIGKWEWEYVVCGFSQGGGGDVKVEEVEIEFRSDSTLVVREHGAITQTAEWQVVELYDEKFEIYVDPEVNQVFGYIEICDDLVVFSYIILDGCNNYLRKK